MKKRHHFTPPYKQRRQAREVEQMVVEIERESLRRVTDPVACLFALLQRYGPDPQDQPSAAGVH